MLLNRRKIGYIISAVAAFVTLVIFISISLHVRKKISFSLFEKCLLLLDLLPYFLMSFIMRKLQEDRYIKLNLCILIFTASAGLFLLIDASYIHPDPLAFLVVPVLQIVILIVPNMIIEYRRRPDKLPS